MSPWLDGGVDSGRERQTIKPFSGKLAPGWQSQLVVTLPRGVLADLRTAVPSTLPNSEGLDRLRRARVRCPPSFPLASTSFGPSLYLHYLSIHHCGHHQLAKTLHGLLSVIHQRIQQGHFPVGHEDDAVRQLLKLIHDFAFPLTVTQGPAYMFLCHMHAIGGRRAWDRDAVAERIKDWVDSKRLFVPTPDMQDHLSRLFDSWRPTNTPRLRLSFRSFCNDPLRWGTSGGARQSKLMGGTYRTKWAWALSRILNPDGTPKPSWDLYSEALAQDPDVAKVALKEESTKTREIITTPMASYMRQAYLAFLWGRPPIDSPIGRPGWLPQFQARRYMWYGAIDGKNFDHHISRSFIFLVLDHLGSLSPEAAAVAQAEKEHLLRLSVEGDGGEQWKYKNGVLSGWRLTSLLDTLATECVIHHITNTTNNPREIAHGSMGDDLALASDTVEIDTRVLAALYDSTGMETNISKTTGGCVGEFLRKVYAPQGVLGYPALGLKGVMFASPWIANFDPTNPQEVSKNWMTWLSRLLPLALPTHQETLSRAVRALCLSDINRWSPKLGRTLIARALGTPVSAGGLGCMEWASGEWWVLKNEHKERARDLLSRFGIGEKRVQLKEDWSVTSLDQSYVSLIARDISRTSNSRDTVKLPPDINLTEVVFRWFLDDSKSAVSVLRELGIQAPSGLRVSGKNQILDYILGLSSGAVGVTSIQSTPEVLGRLSAAYKPQALNYLMRRRGRGIRYLPAAITCLQAMTRSQTAVVRGTW